MGQKIFLKDRLVDAADAKVSVYDHGLLYGDGVFEGIRSYNRRVFKLKEHMDRLYESAEAIRLTISMSKEEFTGKVIETLRANDLDDAYIRVVVTRGEGDLGLDPRKCKTPTIFIIADTIALYPEKYYTEGLPIAIAKTRRNHPITVDPRIKSLSYLNNILGRIDAIDAGTPEALMLTLDGYVVECTGDNIFIVKEGKLLTPPSDLGALEGVTQDTVIDIAKGMGIETEFKKMIPEEIFQAEECFLTGTAAEVVPVIKIGEHTMSSGKPGKMTKQLIAKYRELTQSEGTEY